MKLTRLIWSMSCLSLDSDRFALRQALADSERKRRTQAKKVEGLYHNLEKKNHELRRRVRSLERKNERAQAKLAEQRARVAQAERHATTQRAIANRAVRKMAHVDSRAAEILIAESPEFHELESRPPAFESSRASPAPRRSADAESSRGSWTPVEESEELRRPMTTEELRHTLRPLTPEPSRRARSSRGPDDGRPTPEQIARDDDLLTTPTAGMFPTDDGLSRRAAVVGLLGVLERLSGGIEPPPTRARVRARGAPRESRRVVLQLECL